MTIINGIIKTKDGYAIKDFMSPDKPSIDIGTLNFETYDSAVHYLANILFPESYRPYLLAVKEMSPDEDTWNNLIFIGNASGLYDNETQKYKSARSLDMAAANDMEQAYVEALDSTYQSIRNMLKS